MEDESEVIIISNKFVTIKSNINGAPKEAYFELVTANIDVSSINKHGSNLVLVKCLQLAMDPYQLNRMKSFSPSQQQQLIFSIWKSTMIGRSTMMVQVHSIGSPVLYQIQGSFNDRTCSIFHVFSSSLSSNGSITSNVLMAQIKRKVESTRNMVLSRDVFNLVVKADFDAAFAMGLVLALDRIDGGEATSIERH